MARGVNEYTADDGVRWEAYAQRFSAWLANPKRDTYPGNPPEGYYEVYKDRQKFAPGPREYADLVNSIFEVPRAPAPPPSINGMVTLPPDAFAAVLNLRSGTEGQLLQMLTADRARDDAARGLVPFAQRGGTYFGHGGGFRGGFGGRGGGYGGRGGGYYGGRGGGRGGRGGYAGRGGRSGGRDGAHWGQGGPLAARVEGQATASQKKKKARFRKHKPGAQAAEMDEYLTEDEDADEQEAGPSGQGDVEIPDEDEEEEAEPATRAAEYNEEAAGFYN